MEGEPEGQERFAEWYVWAKREVATDTGVCLGAARAAMDALEGGADELAAKRAARTSVAGHGTVLASRIEPRLRAYAEWYDWARRDIGGGRERQHLAARAAIRTLDAGGDAGKAASTARAAAGVQTPAPPPPPAPAQVAPVSVAAAPQAPQAAVALPPPPAVPPTVQPAEPAPSPVQPAEAPHAVRHEPPPVPPAHAYAGFWRRTGAALMDAVLLGITFTGFLFLGLLFVGISLNLSGQEVTNEGALGIFVAIVLILFVLAWLYYAGLESSAWRATIGKRSFGLLVTDAYGRRISFGRATGRYYGKIVSALTLLIGYVLAAFTDQRQALHDLMAGTLVVRKAHLGLLTEPPPPHQIVQAGGTGGVQSVS
jgi:uncharacterized RDD family membrane protein YckC